MKVEPRWLFAAAVGFVLAGVGVSHVAEGIVTSWQLDVWRVDLDDLLGETIQFGFLVVAFLALRRRTEEAHKRIDQNGDSERELEKKEEHDVASLHERIRRLEEDR